MVDRLFSEPRLAELYDAFCAGRPDFDFYLPLVMSAKSVLDVGCGTGELLRLAREAGHTGRLCGLDPAEAMLQVAQQRLLRRSVCLRARYDGLLAPRRRLLTLGLRRTPNLTLRPPARPLRPFRHHGVPLRRLQLRVREVPKRQDEPVAPHRMRLLSLQLRGR